MEAKKSQRYEVDILTPGYDTKTALMTLLNNGISCDIVTDSKGFRVIQVHHPFDVGVYNSKIRSRFPELYKETRNFKSH